MRTRMIFGSPKKRETFPYVWFRKEPKEYKGKPCRVVAKLEDRKVIVEFEDGVQITAPILAIRKK